MGAGPSECLRGMKAWGQWQLCFSGAVCSGLWDRVQEGVWAGWSARPRGLLGVSFRQSLQQEGGWEALSKCGVWWRQQWASRTPESCPSRPLFCCSSPQHHPSPGFLQHHLLLDAEWQALYVEIKYNYIGWLRQIHREENTGLATPITSSHVCPVGPCSWKARLTVLSKAILPHKENHTPTSAISQ